ncbi:piggyBac transposable element-derived protein 4-like [Bufo gargarizans]|uniref:piggyBac transposable element-derived protein 4-like n=1 Tax=Bufo gargarizans TaxID=30331 RepID=UPI001CF3B41A|nr:piggyBac transposable element-derived protein 4-like [Bufo gargarizans]
MASKKCHCTTKVCFDQLSDSDTEVLAELSDSESWGDLWSDTNLESDNGDDPRPDLSHVRTWCPIDCNTDQVAPPRFPLTGSPGMKADVESDNPQAYLQLFLTEEVIEKIVMETNRYQQQLSATQHAMFSRSRKWEPVTKEDMWQFLGLIILQGVNGKPLQKWYWTTNMLLATPLFGTVMSEYWFSLIIKYFHFTNNEEFDERTYVTERDVSVDKSLMACKGRLSWIQYIASKREWFGIKSYMLCESSTLVIYTGNRTKFNPRYSVYGMATSSVLTLLEPLLNQGYCVTTDNFYTSPELYEVLLQNKTNAYGTVRPNRCDMPFMFAKNKLKIGEMVAWQKGKMMAMRWQDKKDVCLMSTVHNTSTAMVHTKGGKDVLKPQVVIDYNYTVGGNQAITFYPAMHKEQKQIL